LHSLKILVVEDSTDAANTMGILLKRERYEVNLAYDGQGAIAAGDKCWPDVVLLDLAIPGCNGYQVAKGIREQCMGKPQPLFIVISGHASEADRQRSIAEGIHLHFAKPMDPDLLLDLLRDLAINRLQGRGDSAANTSSLSQQ
jgi:CheY-like chemotaxis protein